MNRFSFVKNADLFSRPFYFSVGDANTKKKRTLFGGFMSLAVIAVALLYLFYLLFLYFNNGMLPKIVKQYFNDTAGEIRVTQNFIAIQVYADGIPLSEYEAMNGLSYFQLNFIFQEYDGLLDVSSIIPSTQCDASSQFAGFFCLDLDAMTSAQKILFVNASNQASKSYIIQIAKCAAPLTCASVTDIDNLIINPLTYVVVYTGISSYNTVSMQLEYSYSLEYFQFDSSLIIESVYSMIRSQTEIISGPIIQTKQQLYHFINLKRYDRPHTQADALPLLGVDGYLHFEFRLDQNYEVNTIQFPMITEVLTQFTSVLNVLLVVGVIANAIADSDMIQDVSSLLLKEYYKNTSLELIARNSNKDSESNNNNNNKRPEANREQVEHCDKDDEEDRKNEQRNVEQIIVLQQQIQQSNFNEHVGKIFKVSLLQRAKILLLGMSSESGGGGSAAKEIRERELKEQVIFKKMIALTQRRVDIYEVYRDLIKIKMVLKFLLSADQFAAISHCGGSIPTTNEANESGQKPSKRRQVYPTRNELLKPIPKELETKEPRNNIDLSDQDDSRIEASKQHIEAGGGGELHVASGMMNQFAMKDSAKSMISSGGLQKQRRSGDLFRNHLDSLDRIEDSPELMQEQLRIFMNRMRSHASSKTPLDERIFSSLIGSSKREDT